MDIYPAIDIMDGEAVRLFKGKKDTKKIYGDPVSKAREFSVYTDKIHIVDLDGAFEGEPKNLDVVERIIEDVDVKVQLGGGLRDHEDISRAYSVGVENAILGTNVFDQDLLEEVTGDFEGITASLDSKEGNIAVEGWREEGSITVKDAYELLREKVDRFIYTSTEKDGALEGVEKVEKFWDEEEFIYAGGVSSMGDILSIKRRGFTGVIIGKALYENEIDLEVVSKKIGDATC